MSAAAAAFRDQASRIPAYAAEKKQIRWLVIAISLSCRRVLSSNTIRYDGVGITGAEWNSYRYGVSVQTPSCSSKKPTRMVAANRPGMAGADPLLIASWFEKEAGAMEQEKDWSFAMGEKPNEAA